MTKRCALLSFVAAVLIVASTGALLAQAPPAARAAGAAASSWSHPRTSWGDPDIHGIWPSANIAGTPFARAADLGERATLTEAEFTKRQQEFAANEARVRKTIDADHLDLLRG